MKIALLVLVLLLTPVVGESRGGSYRGERASYSRDSETQRIKGSGYYSYGEREPIHFNERYSPENVYRPVSKPNRIKGTSRGGKRR